jgi:hypothetical protein
MIHEETDLAAPYDRCDHCEHDINDPPHDIPCPEGCNDAGMGAFDGAPGHG